MSEQEDSRRWGWLHDRAGEDGASCPILYNTAARVGIDPWRDQVLQRELSAWVDDLAARLRERDEQAGAMLLSVTDLVDEPGGRARLAIVVATLLAERRFRVVLVDADLRRVGLAQFLRVRSDDAEGIVDALQYGASPAALLLPTEVEGVRAIPVGSYRPDHGEVLVDEDLRRVVAQLRSVADVVLIVSPAWNVDDRFHPLLVHADEVLLGFDLDRSMAPALDELREYLRGLGVPLAAMVPRVDSDAASQAVDVALSPDSEREPESRPPDAPFRNGGDAAEPVVGYEDEGGGSSPVFRAVLLVLVIALLGFVGWWGWMEMRAQDEGLEDRPLAELARPSAPERSAPSATAPGGGEEGEQAIASTADTASTTAAGATVEDAAGDEVAVGAEGPEMATEEEPPPVESSPAEEEATDEEATEEVAPGPPEEFYAAVGGGWALHPWSFADSTDAATAMRPLVREGMQPVVRRAEIDGQTWFRVLVGNFESRGDAWQARAILAEMVDTDWIGVVRVR